MVFYKCCFIKCVEIFLFKGNSLSSATQDRDVLDKARYLLRNNMAASIEAVHSLDDVVFQLAVINY